MNEMQAEQMIRLLEDIRDDMRGMRSEFLEFTGHNVYKVSEILDTVTGPLSYNLGDLHSKLDDLHSILTLIDINTTA